jgi:predicted transcriptional regulator
MPRAKEDPFEIKDQALYIKTLYFLSKAENGLRIEDFQEMNKSGLQSSQDAFRDMLYILTQRGLVEKKEEIPRRYMLTQSGAEVYKIDQNKFENLKILAPLDPTLGAAYASVQLQHVREALNQARLDALIYAGKTLDDVAVQNLQIAKSVLDRIIEESQQTSKLLSKYIENKPL